MRGRKEPRSQLQVQMSNDRHLLGLTTHEQRDKKLTIFS